MDGIIHLHKHELGYDLRIFWLIIPIIVFILVSVILLSQRPKSESLSSIATPNVLGTTTKP